MKKRGRRRKKRRRGRRMRRGRRRRRRRMLTLTERKAIAYPQLSIATASVNLLLCISCGLDIESSLT